VRKELIMALSPDPPSVERKLAEFCKRVRGFGRKLVNRRTLLTAFQIVLWTVRIAKLMKQLFGDL
jgi:hypothetical protein